MNLYHSFIIETPRLILRPWTLEDADDLFYYASSPNVGPRAGWLPHQSVEESRTILTSILSVPECFAIVYKETNEVIGSVTIMVGRMSHLKLPKDEAELGYWIGEPFWGQGLMPEVVEAVLHHGFVNLHLKEIWAGYYDGNHQSQRVQEKTGMSHRYTLPDVFSKELNECRTEHISSITFDEWSKRQEENK